MGGGCLLPGTPQSWRLKPHVADIGRGPPMRARSRARAPRDSGLRGAFLFTTETQRLRFVYVQDAADLERRLEKLDCAPEPARRYRVHDFFCFDGGRLHSAAGS